MTIQNILKQIGQVGDKEKTQVYAVGGFVRDQIMKRECKDLDFVVLGNGIEFGNQVFKALKAKDFVKFEDFNTCQMKLGDYLIEFVGARKEKYPKESRKPEVKPATLIEDLQRRDFTINAIAMELNKKEFGEIVDLFGGQEDIAKKIIKTPLEPHEIFEEDPLRIMRAIRFASQLGFRIEENTYKAIYDTRKRLGIISWERIRDELIKILLSPQPSIGLRLLYNTKILEIILPELSCLYGFEQKENVGHKNILTHTFQVVDQLAEKIEQVKNDLSAQAGKPKKKLTKIDKILGSLETNWREKFKNKENKGLILFAALLHDIGKAKSKEFQTGKGWTFIDHDIIGAKMSKGICLRFKLSNDQRKYIYKLIRWHYHPVQLNEQNPSDSAIRRLIVNLGEDLEDLLLLGQADITSKSYKRREIYLERYDKLKAHLQEVKEKDRLRSFQSPVRGEEIMKIAGLKPGPEVGKLKKAIEDAILEGKIKNDYKQALEYLKKILLKK